MAAEVEKIVSAAPEKWKLTREAFDEFLLTLDPDRDIAGLKYELLRS